MAEVPEPIELVRACAVEVLEVEEQDVTEGARLKEDLGANSLTLVELAMALEERLGRELSEKDVAGVATVADLCAVVERLRGP